MAPSKYGIMARRPNTKIYNDNYLFGFNFYEDMMTWLKKREQGVTEPVPRLPTVPETAFRKFAKPQRPGAFEQECDDAARRTHDRIESLVWRKERAPRAPRRARSFGAFSSQAISDIEQDMRTEAMASQVERSATTSVRTAQSSIQSQAQTSTQTDSWSLADDVESMRTDALRAYDSYNRKYRPSLRY